MNNIDIAHKFFYSNGGRYYPNYKSLGYDGDSFYSYYTIIGQIVTDKNNVRVLLASDSSMSTSTAKHLNYLLSACPFEYIRVPFIYGDHYFKLEKTASRCLELMEFYAGQKLTQAFNRDQFIHYFNTFNTLKARFKLPAKLKIPAKFKKLYNTLNDSEALKALKAKQRAADIKKATAERKAFEKLIKGRKISELARLAYSYDSDLDSVQKAKLKKQLNPRGDLAFIWKDENGDFKTSKNITVKAEEGNRVLTLYKAGKLKHGEKVDFYTVLSITPEIVKIGCHNILTANLAEF